jgi:hypothetical protein
VIETLQENPFDPRVEIGNPVLQVGITLKIQSIDLDEKKVRRIQTNSQSTHRSLDFAEKL